METAQQNFEYELEEKLHEGKSTVVYRGRLKESARSVIIKTARGGQPSARDRARLRQEYEFGRDLPPAVTARPLGLEENGGDIALILEDIGGVSLQQLVGSGRLAVRSFLKLARLLAKHLAAIHAAGIIHKDIKPQNVIANTETNDVRFIDFGIASRLSLKSRHLGNPEVLEGSLPYMSPEQTGRMNRFVDHRSDLYSLGVAFYELLTKRLPFESRDPMELVHAHIARMPEPVHRINPKVPELVSNIVMRLLAKSADDRYQSADGLEYDLGECLRAVDAGETPHFEIGTMDFSGVFRIPQKLYGRENQLGILMDAFERAAGGSCEMMLVSGYSGVGKSALINEVHKPITARRGNFISGKYDQFQRNIPYSAVRQAFEDFTNLLLTENSSRLSRWRERILDAVGDDGGFLTDVLPELERIIGRQTKPAELSAQETQIRFLHVFQKFLAAISGAEHPLVLFIDDLQWADNASLALIKSLMTDANNSCFLFIGAYRDNEVDDHHPFMLTVAELRKLGVLIHDVVLSNLSVEDVQRLVVDSLSTNPGRTGELTNLIYSKTQGNAFFTTELLRDLYENEHLKFHPGERTWRWDVEHITGLNITDNVVELMTAKIERLPETVREVLKLAACIGARFDLEVLAIIHEEDRLNTLHAIWPAVQEQLLVPLDENYRFVRDADAESTASFRFAHDRVQQAAYALMQDSERPEVHLRIGRLLHSHASAGTLEDRLFDIVYQMNLGAELLSNEDDRLSLITLNLQAAEKAVKSSAFQAALSYVKRALPLFDADAWDDRHDLIYEAYRLKAACEYSSYRLEECDATVKEILPRCRTETERVNIYTIQLNNLFALNRHEESLAVTREALSGLGIRMPRNAGKLDICLEFSKFGVEFGRRRTEDLLELPETSDEHVLNQLKILYNSVESSYIIQPDLMGWLVTRMARICLRYGNSEYSAFAFTCVPLVLGGVLKQFEAAWKFCELGLQLNKFYPHIDVQARCHFLAGNFALHWVHPIRTYEEYIHTALRCAVDSGNVHWGNYSLAFSRTQSLFFNPAPLPEIEAANFRHYEFHARSRDREVTLNQFFLLKYLAELQGKGSDLENIFDFDPDSYAAEMHTPGNYLMREYFFTISAMRAYDAGRAEEALAYAWKGFKIVLEILGVLLDYQHRWFYQLIYLRWRSRLGFWKRCKMSLGYRVNRFLLRRYAKSAPENYRAPHAIFLAEEAAAKNRRNAPQMFEAAVQEAQKTRIPQFIIRANELAGRYCIEHGEDARGREYLNAAVLAAEDWGAFAHAESLRRHYRLLQHRDPTDRVQRATITTSTATTGLSSLDFAAVIKASQALSGELQRERLLAKLMQNVIENAGAERACLLQKHGDEALYVAAENSTSMTEPVVLQSIPLSESSLALSVAQFVERTGETVVLDDASGAGKFLHDPHIAENRVKSLLCRPITSGGRMLGLLYLENNLTTNAFTPHRLEVFGILSSQAAVSLENARLVAEETERQKLQREMEMARQVQTSILPRNTEDSAYAIAAHMTPAAQVGGDYYDYYLRGDRRWIAVGDVTGHGLNSGLLMLMAQTAFSMYLNTTTEPDIFELLQAMNRTLYENMVDRTNQNLYMTFTVLSADAYGNFEHAGKHEDILVWRRSTGSVEVVASNGVWMAVVPELKGAMLERSAFHLDPGDMLCLYTDGIIEARNRSGEQFDSVRLIETIERSAPEGVDAVRDGIVKACFDFLDVQDDDVTLFVMQRK